MPTTPLTKVHDVAFPRLCVPDLDRMETFLLEFGMVVQARTSEALYLRGMGSAHHVSVVHRGEPGFRGFAFRTENREDLERLAASPGFSPVAETDEPGGGYRTKTTDLDGNQIEVIFGLETLDPLASNAPRPLNMGNRFERIGQTQRIEQGPSRVKRFGHLALNVSDVGASLAWYQERFGILASDRVCLAPDFPVAIFTRCDRGALPADHHSILLASSLTSNGESGLNHVSWEVTDIDDVLAGSEHLARQGRTHEWGVGRHLLGSQVFDYWRDPWGQIHEHWTDGDQFDASVPTQDHGPETALASQWGPNPPMTFGRTIAPEQS